MAVGEPSDTQLAPTLSYKPEPQQPGRVQRSRPRLTPATSARMPHTYGDHVHLLQTPQHITAVDCPKKSVLANKRWDKH